MNAGIPIVISLERLVIKVTAFGVEDRGSIADTDIFLFATSYVITSHSHPAQRKAKAIFRLRYFSIPCL